MNTTASSTASPVMGGPTRRPVAARSVLRLLDRIDQGALEVQLPDGTQMHCGPAGAEPRAAMRWHDWQVASACLSRGDIGLAESYIDGHWSTPDLPGLLKLFLNNRATIEQAIYGSWWGSLLARLRHLRNHNSRTGSRRNIHAHYDLGNDFYTRWLDPSMSYSAAWFGGNVEQPLIEAQYAKMARALDEVRLRPGQRLLEIGCGWGAMAEAAALRGAQVTGLTLSTEQLDWAQERLVQAGLSERVDLRLQDYRELHARPFDAVVSIEMFEAVGERYWPQYFSALARLLKPGGRACIQSITIREDLFERYRRSTDFIQQYIFPGGMLPSVSAFTEAARQAGLVVERQLNFGPDYAETLRRWRRNFLAASTEITALGFDQPFMRTWEFYLGYCEAAFDAGNTDVVQFTLRRL